MGEVPLQGESTPDLLLGDVTVAQSIRPFYTGLRPQTHTLPTGLSLQTGLGYTLPTGLGYALPTGLSYTLQTGLGYSLPMGLGYAVPTGLSGLTTPAGASFPGAPHGTASPTACAGFRITRVPH